MNTEFDPVTSMLLAILVLFFTILFLAGLSTKISEFSRELKYINQEIERTTGGERRYWQHQKRRLWLSLLPFYRG